MVIVAAVAMHELTSGTPAGGDVLGVVSEQRPRERNEFADAGICNSIQREARGTRAR